MTTSLPISQLPGRLLGAEHWSSGLPTLTHQRHLMWDEVFDPFDHVDQTLHRQLHWLMHPESMRPITQQPDEPHRYRLSLDCRGFSPKSLKIDLKDVKGQKVLKVCGLEESGNKNSDDFHRKELKKSFTLPKNVECNKLVSFMTPEGKLIIEMPFKRMHEAQLASMLPHIVDTKTGKEMRIKLPLPEGISAEKVHVMVKDRDLIVQCEDRVITPDSLTRVHVINRVTLPENIQWSALKCVKQEDAVVVTAPLNDLNMPEVANVKTAKQDDKKKKPAQDEPVELPIDDWPTLQQQPGKKKAKGKN